MGRLSVVVPVYNVGSYLDACLESLEAQTFRDIDVICVNDGSTDDSLERLHSWAARDSRVRVINKENGGLSSARNAGIRVATSEFVCFLDSDDVFLPEACETIVQQLADTRADVLTFGATYVPAEPHVPWLDDVLTPRDVVYDGFSMDVLFKEKSRPFAWRMACRTRFLTEHEIWFDEDVPFGEDQVFCFAVYPRAERIAFCSKKLYEYKAARPGSLMDRMNNDPRRKMLAHADIVDHILADWRRLALLGRYGAEMVCWALDFVLTEMLRAPQGDFAAVANGLADVLGRYWTPDQVKVMNLIPADRALALSLVGSRRCSLAARKWAARAFYLARYGHKATYRWLVSGWYLQE